ncbi:MAG: hypothetical protein V3T84_00825 [Phycisphaerales bacterium]
MSWPWIIVLFIIVDILIAFSLIAASLKLLWNPLHLAYPPRTPADDAVRKQLQSFRIGLLNLSYCIHAAVDENHLHLMPATLVGWLGAKPTSIPWDAIEVLKRSQFGQSMIVRVGKRRITGPAWCLGLAEPAESNECTKNDKGPGPTHDPATPPNRGSERKTDRVR